MPKYRCVNEDCASFDREITITKVRLVFNKETQKLETTEPILCRDCGREMQPVKQEGPISVNITTFSSKTPQEKREMMHKRSQEHFRKTDKGDLANYKKRMIEDLRRKAEGRCL